MAGAAADRRCPCRRRSRLCCSTIAPFVLGTGLLLLAAGRPLFAGVIPLALGAGFALTDDTMRQDLARAGRVFRIGRAAAGLHPPASLSAICRAGAGDRRCGGGGDPGSRLLICEPPLWPAQPLTALAVDGCDRSRPAGSGCGNRCSASVAARLRRLEPSGEPFADAAALGPFAMLIVHTVIARAERPARQRALALRRDADPHPASPRAATRAARSSSCNASRSSMRADFRRVFRANSSQGSISVALAGCSTAGSRFRAGAPTRCAPSSRS